MKKNEIYYATSNPGKFEEIKHYIDQYEPSLVMKQFDVDIAEIQSLDQEKVAIDKARKAWEILQKPLLIDDGGIFFKGYHQFPGTLSKYVFQGLGFDGLFKLVDEGDEAAFILQMVYVDADHLEIFEGRCEGSVVRPKNVATHPHLPFTAIFKPKGCDKSFAELRGTKEFEQYSFRHQALKKFIAWYKMHN